MELNSSLVGKYEKEKRLRISPVMLDWDPVYQVNPWFLLSVCLSGLLATYLSFIATEKSIYAFVMCAHVSVSVNTCLHTHISQLCLLRDLEAMTHKYLC